MTNLILKRAGFAALAMLVLFLFLRSNQAQAVPAFPGAEGGGAASTGGRATNGRVILVTTLANGGTGSLRDCIAQSGPRTCVFRVGGSINLSSTLQISNPFLTIAGQTAPGGGIELRGTGLGANMINLTTNNVIIRYIKIRKGFNSTCGSGAGSDCGASIHTGLSARHVIIDHITNMWNQDEGMGMSGKNMTYSYNLGAEGLESHSTGMLAGEGTPTENNSLTDLDLHHNLTMSNNHRNPLWRHKNGRSVNNIWYNNRLYASHFCGGGSFDVIGNKYERGPMNPSAAYYEIGVGGCPAQFQAAGTPNIYIVGNIGWHQTNPNGDQTPLTNRIEGENGPDKGPMPTSWRRGTPQSNTAFPITASPVTDLDTLIIPTVGASRRLDCEGKWVINRDTTDARLISQYQNKTGAAQRQATEVGYGGYPVIAGGTACPDSDNDGMPNAYEVIKGYSTSVANNNTVAGNGFSQLENFLAGESGVTPPPAGDKFQDDDRVFVTSSTVNVRATAGGTLLGTQVQGAQGVVTDGPTPTLNGVIWYNINFDSGTDGWVGDDNIELVVDADTPPTVSVTAPATGATVQGAAVSVTATASDNLGVSGVQFKLDGELLGAEDTTSPYGVTWNTTGLVNGLHTLCAVARDAAGNTTTSAEVEVTVNNVVVDGGFNIGETALIGATDTPGADQIRTRAITLLERATLNSVSMYASASGGNIRMGVYDDTGVGGIPGVLKAESAGGAPGAVGWYTQSMVTPVILDPGTYWIAFVTQGSFQARGLSTGGNNRRRGHVYGAFSTPFVENSNDTWRWSMYASFTPAQDTTGPAVSITAPSPGNVSGAAVSITATATDAVGVSGVQFKLDGTINIGAEDTTSTYGVTWDTTAVVNGPYTLTAIGRDEAGNMTISAGVAVTVANPLDAPSGLAVIRVAQ